MKPNEDVRMYIEEFILDDLHYLMYKMELRYCVEITLVFIQSQQWMRNDRLPSRPSHPYGRQPHSLIFMSTLYKATCCLPASS